MIATAVDILATIGKLSTAERRALVASIVRDFAERDGQAEAIQFLFANVFGGDASQDPQVETILAFARLPKDALEEILEPVDPATIRLEDCLSPEEIDQMLKDAD